MARKNKTELSDLVAQIYEAAVGTALWPDVVAQITRAAGAQRYAMAPIKPLEVPPLPVTVHPDVLTSLDAFYSLKITNPFTTAVSSPRVREGDVVTRSMLIDDRTWRKSDVYNLVTRPADLEEMAVIALYCESNDLTDRTYLAIFRDAGLPAFEVQDLQTLRRLSPHLRRAADITQRLRAREELGRAAMEALDAVSTGMILVSVSGTILHANSAAEAMLRSKDGLAAKHGRIAAADDRVTAALVRLIAEAVLSFNLAPPSAGGAMHLPRPSGLPSWQITVSPLAPNNPFTLGPSHAAGLVMITDPAAQAHSPDATLRALFGLTSAEARVALGLANGLTPHEISNQHQLSLFTIRTHIRNLHDKLGVRHQGQLIRRILQVTQVTPPMRSGE